MVTNVKKIWEKEYKPLLLANEEEEARQPPILVEEYLCRAQALQMSGGDDFEAYIRGPQTIFHNADDVIPWVLSAENPWPAVKQQVLDVLSIPSMFAELERVFSQAKLTITPTRNALSAETVEILELLRHWWVNNIITQQRGGSQQARRKRKPLLLSEIDSEVINTTGDSEGNGDGLPN